MGQGTQPLPRQPSRFGHSQDAQRQSREGLGVKSGDVKQPSSAPATFHAFAAAPAMPFTRPGLAGVLAVAVETATTGFFDVCSAGPDFHAGHLAKVEGWRV